MNTPPDTTPPPPPILPPEDEGHLPAAAQAAQQRQTALRTASQQAWADIPLHGWTRGRETLFVTLMERHEAQHHLDSLPLIQQRLQQAAATAAEGQDMPQLEDLVSPLLYLEQAALVLYLAAHEPPAWDALRGSPPAFFRAATAWAETHIPLGQEWAAIHRAVELRTAHLCLVPVRRPTRRDRPGADRAGN